MGIPVAIVGEVLSAYWTGTVVAVLHQVLTKLLSSVKVLIALVAEMMVGVGCLMLFHVFVGFEEPRAFLNGTCDPQLLHVLPPLAIHPGERADMSFSETLGIKREGRCLMEMRERRQISVSLNHLEMFVCERS